MRKFYAQSMNTRLILNTGIENIDTVYGGVRGTTLSSRHNLRHWQTVVQSGVKTVVELRDVDHSDRLCCLCEQNNIRYFAFPLDSHIVPNEVIAPKLQELFKIIDGGDFYIACAMGLHRTDMALSIYWMFHGADLNLQPPYLKGHFPMSDSGRKGVDPGKIFRRLNSLYEYLTENRLIDIQDKATFTLRRKELIEFSKKASI